MEKPPVIATDETKRSGRSAFLMNLICPGLGQIMQGHKVAGVIILITFLADFTAMMSLFLHDLLRSFELTLNGNILESGRLEQIEQVYHTKTLLVLLAVGIIIYLVSVFGWTEPAKKRA